MIKIKNGRVILDKLTNTNVYIENGIIHAVTTEDLPCNEEIDAQGLFVSPGFIDTHVHGGGNHDFMDGGTEPVKKVLKTHLKHETTTILPTTIADSKEAIISSISDIKKSPYRG